MNEFEMMKRILEREKEIFKIAEIEGEGPEILIFNPQSCDPNVAVAMSFDEEGQMASCPYPIVLVEEEFEELAQQYRESVWYDPNVEQKWIKGE